MSVKVGANVDAKPLRVSHADLQRFGNTDSAYRRLCPVCLKGALMVTRDRVSRMLVNVDRCTHCGQVLIYSDRFIGGEPVSHIEKEPS